MTSKMEKSQDHHSNIDPNCWTCEKCTYQNVSKSNKCSMCESLNNISNKTTRNVDETEWKCWNKNCQQMNTIEHEFCQHCKRNETLPIESCFICNTKIEPDDENCSMCGERVANMSIPDASYKRKLKNSNNNDDFKMSKIDSACSQIGINTNEEIDKSNSVNSSKLECMEIQNGNSETQDNIRKIVHDILSKNPDRWICNPCKQLNSFNEQNCGQCDALCTVNGFWICSNCNFINQMCNEICSVCDHNNELINKWKCWKPHCGALNDNKLKFCFKCYLQRTPPVPFSDLIEREVNGKVLKFWICEKCWQYNNPSSENCIKKCCRQPRFKEKNKITNIITCDTNLYSKEQTNLRNPEAIFDMTSNNLNERDTNKMEKSQENYSNIDPNCWTCEKCTYQNASKSNKCSACQSLNNISNKTTRNVDETEWKCWKKNCQQINKIKHEFCQRCKLDKNPPDPKTKLVKSYAGKVMKEIWICEKCEKYNSKDEAKCEGKNCGSYKFYTSNDSKDDKNKSKTNQNKSEMITNSCPWECHKCTFVNDHDGNSCTVCNSKKNSDSNFKNNCETSNSWKCWFMNCRQSNDNQYKFCQNCKLDRYGTNDRGALVKQQDKNDIKDIWICQKCFKYNSLSNNICGGKSCDNRRFN